MVEVMGHIIDAWILLVAIGWIIGMSVLWAKGLDMMGMDKPGKYWGGDDE